MRLTEEQLLMTEEILEHYGINTSLKHLNKLSDYALKQIEEAVKRFKREKNLNASDVAKINDIARRFMDAWIQKRKV